MCIIPPRVGSGVVMFSGVLGELESEEVAGNILTCAPDTGDGVTLTATGLPKLNP